MKIKQIYEFLDSIAPYETQCPWDNSGIMTGSADDEIDSVIVCLDCTNDVIRQANEKNIKLIISHHPLIFHPVKRVDADTPLHNAIRSGITVISAHTNLDMAQGGVNDALCSTLEIKNTAPLIVENAPIMRTGENNFLTARAFAEFCSKKLGNSVKFTDSGKGVKKIAVCSGAGGEYIYAAAASGCDTFVTGEAKHHEYLDAERLGLNLLVAGHFSTEQIVIPSLCDKLKKTFPNLDIVTAREKCPYETVV